MVLFWTTALQCTLITIIIIIIIIYTRYNNIIKSSVTYTEIEMKIVYVGHLLPIMTSSVRIAIQFAYLSRIVREFSGHFISKQ